MEWKNNHLGMKTIRAIEFSQCVINAPSISYSMLPCCCKSFMFLSWVMSNV